MPKEYEGENVEWVAKGCENLIHHINNVKKAGISPVVCINAFYTDTDAEIAKVRELSEATGAKVALSRHWEQGGDGALEFADAVVEACEDETEFKYGADGVDFSGSALKSLDRIEKDPELSQLGLCMVKTHLSLSDNPALKGCPKGWRLQVREVLTYGGAGFIVPVAGAISLMPGTGSNPAFRRVDVDTETGKVKGLF